MCVLLSIGDVRRMLWASPDCRYISSCGASRQYRYRLTEKQNADIRLWFHFTFKRSATAARARIVSFQGAHSAPLSTSDSGTRRHSSASCRQKHFLCTHKYVYTTSMIVKCFRCQAEVTRFRIYAMYCTSELLPIFENKCLFFPTSQQVQRLVCSLFNAPIRVQRYIALRVCEQETADEVARQCAQFVERLLLRAAVVAARDVVICIRGRLAAERRDSGHSTCQYIIRGVF